MSDNERAIANQSQEKFQFYAVSLVFTILGLSIQTANFDGHIVARICELLSWLMLLISGLSGLSHLEWNPVIHVQMVRKDELEATESQLQDIEQLKVLLNDTTVPISEPIEEHASYIKKLDDELTELDSKAEIKYSVFKWCFAIGITLLVVSRSIAPIFGILTELSQAIIF